MRTAYLERVVLGDERGVLSWLVRAALWPLSVVYRIGLAVYLAVYSSGLRKRYRLPVPVVSVGNLTFGGTGKTPAVEAICRMLLEQGLRVTVLSRGYGGSARGPVIVSGGATIRCESSECGDEPIALARALPGVSVVVGKDRRKSGELACSELSPDVIVLDDGMQYWQLHRDLEIAVVDATRPFGSGFVMPMGDLREPVGGIRRAAVVLVTGAGLTEGDWAGIESRVRKRAPEALVHRCVRKPAWLRHIDVGQVELGWLSGRRVLAFCGIGRPDSFVGTLTSLGADVVENLAFPDHHSYTESDIALIESKRSELGVEAVVTTEKDYARLADASICRTVRGSGLARSATVDDLYVLGIELEIEHSRKLEERLAAVVDGARKASAN